MPRNLRADHSPSAVLIILADQLSNAADIANTSRSAEYKLVTGEYMMPSEFDVTSASAGEMFVGALLQDSCWLDCI